ncbi:MULTISPECIES: TadE family protein [unclassified Streptomyces]|uniref:TadE family protein n=1 Tax=unclassified Streptomyces TaxID=2593676 RepID=UPI0033BCE266
MEVAEIRRRDRVHDDRGQLSVEFTGTFPLILLTLVVLWQCALVGYTFILAGNAADRGVRAAAASGDMGDCRSVGREDLPQEWRGAEISCSSGEELVKATVSVPVPILFPGGPKLPIKVPGRAAAAKEGIEP